MLLTALEIAYRALEKIKCRPNETHEYDWDAYNALKDIEHSAVMPWVDKQGPFLETLNIAHKNAHALGQVISLGHENCEGM